MTSKHPIACVAISAAVALKLFAGTADAAALKSADVHEASGRPIIVTGISNPTAHVQLGRGVDIARVDGEIVNSW